MDLTTCKALSFDCYGTLIDWETGLLGVLRPWAAERGLAVTDDDLLVAYARSEAEAERDMPTVPYPEILAESFRRTGRLLNARVNDHWATRLGASIADWPAFADSSAALATLAEHYCLIVLSNVDRAGFVASNVRLRGNFAAVITAEDVGAYKPADNHFHALEQTLADLAIERGELIHVAQSLHHDHVPARRHDIRSVWINRRHDRPGWGATPEPRDEFSYDLEYPSMHDFAAAVAAAFGAAE